MSHSNFNAPTDPAAAVIVTFGLTDPAEVRAAFDHAASLLAYQRVCADGHKPADVARVLPATRITQDRLVEVFGDKCWGDIDEALFEATRAVTDWSTARTGPVARELARLREPA